MKGRKPHAERIVQGVFRVGGRGLTEDRDAAIYLYAAGDRAVLIDAGCGGAIDRLLANVVAAGVAPSAIDALLLTHCHFDHTGGAAVLRDRLGCTVVMHELDAAFLEHGDGVVTAAGWYGERLQPCPVDRRLTGARETVTVGHLGLEAVHIPGHSPGSVAYVTTVDGETVVFAQDVHGPLHPSLLSDAADYQASLQRLLALQADVLCEGHFGVFRGRPEVAAFIQSFVAPNA